MRVLFYTAAIIAATFAQVAQSVTFNSVNQENYESFAELDSCPAGNCP